MTRTDSNSLRPLPPRSLAALLLAMFAIAIALGYGFLLPILPSTIARIAGTSDPAILAQHTGVLTGTYTLELFLFAPLWGRFSDRYGRRPAIVVLAASIGLPRLLKQPEREGPDAPASTGTSRTAAEEGRRS